MTAPSMVSLNFPEYDSNTIDPRKTEPLSFTHIMVIHFPKQIILKSHSHLIAIYPAGRRSN